MGLYGPKGVLRPVSAQVGKKKKSGLMSSFTTSNSKVLEGYDVRTRPKQFYKDKEGLYDEALQSKKNVNKLKQDNTHLRTQLKQMEQEMQKRETLLDEIIAQQ